MAQRVFDGHNDALLRSGPDAFIGGRPDGHLDLPRARAGGLAGGIFAVFTPSPGDEEVIELGGDAYDVPLPEPVPQDVAAGHCTRMAGRLHALERAGAVRIVRRAADLDAGGDALLAVLHLEGAEAIDARLEALEHWHAAGLRSLGPVWSRPNAFGHGVPFRFPGSPDTGPGLTEAGLRLVRRCNELGIVVDVSHLNAAGFRDVARVSEAPLVASHSAVWELCRSTRNLMDEQLDAIGASGGLVGIVFAAPFVRADGHDDADVPLRAVAEHACYVAERIGVEHVALGSDFDGATMPAELGDAAGLPRLLGALRDAGLGAGDVEAIAFGNWRRVLAETLR